MDKTCTELGRSKRDDRLLRAWRSSTPSLIMFNKHHCDAHNAPDRDIKMQECMDLSAELFASVKHMEVHDEIHTS